MPAFDPLDHPIHSIPEILAEHMEKAMSLTEAEALADAVAASNGVVLAPVTGVITAAQEWSVVRHIREAMANREQYDRDHDAKQIRECEPL